MKKIYTLLWIILVCLGSAQAVTKTAIKSSELMKVITDDITSNFTEYSIVEAFKVNNNGIISYELILKHDESKIIVYYNEVGKFIRKANSPATYQGSRVNSGKSDAGQTKH